MTAKERALSDFFPALRDDAYFMKEALTEARKAFEEDEVPIGAVIVSGGEIIGRGYNRTEALSDVTAHAEMLAITAAQNALGSKVLPDCTLFVTVEPCVMCAGAILQSRIGRVVFGAWDDKAGAAGSMYDVLRDRRLPAQGFAARLEIDGVGEAFLLAL